MSTQTIDTTDANSAHTRRPGESPRQQSVCIEIAVTAHGSRSATGTPGSGEGAKPFLEETRTMIVFPQGAVLRLTEPVSEGQILILKNARVKQEVACRVVSSKTNASAKGYVEVEFFQPAPGFWGITFPGASSAPPADSVPAAPVSKTTRPEPTAAKQPFFKPPVVSPQTSAPVAPAAPRPAPVQSPVSSTPVRTTPVIPAPTPDSTQELNRAIAAAYAAPLEPVKKLEQIQESKNAQDSVAVSAPPSPAPAATVPPSATKTINPTKPKPGAQPVKATMENFSASTPTTLATADSIGHPGSDFATHYPPVSSTKPSRSSARSSVSTVETRKVELTSSQIASEAVLGKPMFSSSSDAASNGSAKSSSTWIIAVAAVVIVGAAGAGLWWKTSHKSVAASASVAAAPPPLSSPTVPATTNPAASAPVTTNPSTTPAPTQNSLASQKNSSTPANIVGNTPNGRADKNSAIVSPRRPNVLSSSSITAPVSHGTSSSIGATPAPDLTSKNSNAPGNSLGSILPGMGQPSSGPAPPPPSSRAAAPASGASVLQQPKLLTSEPAVYPRIAATRGDWGDVLIDAVVGENGKVTDAKVISGPATLQQSALQVVRTQTYQPARLNGKAVSAHVTVKVPFAKPH